MSWKLFQTIDLGGAQERKIPQQGPVEEAGQQRSREEIVQVRRCEKRKPKTRANSLQPIPDRQILESECGVQYKKGKESSDQNMKNRATRCLSELICLRQLKQRCRSLKDDW
jgi:hypothetical protein